MAETSEGTTTFTVEGAEVQPLTVVVAEYAPDSFTCKDEPVVPTFHEIEPFAGKERVAGISKSNPPRRLLVERLLPRCARNSLFRVRLEWSERRRQGHATRRF
ncbi:MAG: hypothetical protein RLZZ378_50 [Actinomycetota bacterium]